VDRVTQNRFEDMRQSRYVLGGAGLATALLSLVAGLEIQLALANATVDVSARAFAPTPVNRHLKGDRLPIVPPQRGENPANEPSLPPGCELRFTSVRNAYKNEVAGRCLAEAPGSGASWKESA
jgi:hypothetical protein